MASFYKALRDGGMSSEQAFTLTRDYMSNMNLGNIIRGATGQREHGGGKGKCFEELARED